MKNRLIIFISLLALCFLGLGIYGEFNKKSTLANVVEVEPTPEIRYVTLWQATSRLNRGSPLELANIEKIEVPLEQALRLGVKEDIILDFSPSTLLNVSLKIGEIVHPEYQVKHGEAGYIDLLVTEGMTLYPLTVNNTYLVNDYIRPGVYVDILSVSSPRLNLADRSDKPNVFQGAKASMFLKKIKVLSVSDLDSDAESNGTFSSRSSANTPEFRTVVLEVNPSDIASLALAQRTTHIEVFRSQSYDNPGYAEVRDVIDNYTGIEELRGNEKQLKEVL